MMSRLRLSVRVESLLSVGVFLLVFAYNVHYSFVNFNGPLTDHHAWRQTQTAITSYYLLQGGPFWDYETPVLGAPWSMPMEWPVYQEIVALMVKKFHTSLDATGRFVSLAFFYLSLFPAYFLLESIGIERRAHRLVILTLLLASPTYLFWSRTFMIESAAVFFGVAYLAALARHLERMRPAWGVLGAAAGLFCGLVKITTFAGFLLAGGLIFANHWWRRHRPCSARALISKHLVVAAWFAVIPLSCSLAWMHHTAEVRARNPIEENFLKVGDLKGVYFGTLAERVDPHIWRDQFISRITTVSGSTLLSAGLSIAALFLPRRRTAYFAGLFIFFAVLMIFTNVHVLHDYYIYAIGIFLVYSIGVFVVALMEGGGIQKAAAYGLFFVILLSMVRVYLRYDGWNQARDHTKNDALLVAGAVEKVTRPEDIILVYGAYWSPVIPYYSHRRALMDPFDEPTSLDDPKMRRAMSNLSGRPIGAVVICDKGRARKADNENRLKRLGFGTVPVFTSKRCDVYAPPKRMAGIRG